MASSALPSSEPPAAPAAKPPLSDYEKLLIWLLILFPTVKEISSLEGVRSGTLQEDLERLRLRMGAHSAEQAAVLAVGRGVIEIATDDDIASLVAATFEQDELKIAELLAQGYTYEHAAPILGWSFRTVNRRMAKLREKVQAAIAVEGYEPRPVSRQAALALLVRAGRIRLPAFGD